MLKKILIANRGEIAVRVIRTAKEMGIATVAVYSDADRGALHVRLADEAYALGGTTSAESYLNTAAILDAIERSGADGVHPGYGFFSENTDFATAITDRGVAFIGPPPPAIEVMGDKVSSRIACQKAGVAMVPGTMDFLRGPDDVRAFGRMSRGVAAVALGALPGSLVGARLSDRVATRWLKMLMAVVLLWRPQGLFGRETR